MKKEMRRRMNANIQSKSKIKIPQQFIFLSQEQITNQRKTLHSLFTVHRLVWPCCSSLLHEQMFYIFVCCRGYATDLHLTSSSSCVNVLHRSVHGNDHMQSKLWKTKGCVEMGNTRTMLSIFEGKVGDDERRVPSVPNKHSKHLQVLSKSIPRDWVGCTKG